MSIELVKNVDLECCAAAAGPGYKSPSDAMKAPREKLLFTVLVYCGEDATRPDKLAVVDADPGSSTYSTIVGELSMTHAGDELHHFGWNTCSSCCHDSTKVRRFLILVGLKSSRIYVVDIAEPTKPQIHKTIEPEEIKAKVNLSALHTVHCLANGNIMISCLGDANGEAPGGFLLLNSEFEIAGRWGEADSSAKMLFNYDFWYQPHHNIMASSEWSAPNTFRKGFDIADVAAGKYGQKVYLWDWREAKIVKELDLGAEGLVPLEVRFHHNPKSSHGFVGAALSASIWHWWKSEESGEWLVEKIIQVEAAENVAGWPMAVPSLISDILLSLDDKFIYFANWFHGDVRQYNIEEPSRPRLVGQVQLGGLIGKAPVSHANGRQLGGGPQMIQLSLDGKRLYVTNSLFSAWDDQFYPDIKSNGSHMIMINCDTDKGGLSLRFTLEALDEKFYVGFGVEDGLKDGPYRAHEMRYPGGDCTSDIWLSDDSAE